MRAITCWSKQLKSDKGGIFLNVVEIAQLAATAAEEKKAQDIIILDIRGLSVFADYFVICHGNSQTQVQAIVNGIKDKVLESDLILKGIEGFQDARWVLIDLGDVVVHVFHKDEREFYDLERLWGDARQLKVQ
ncbi:ribosome silencing factor [Thermoactinomyces sp. CICC 10521]|jgi:ribosome-associated protein|uniref:Ribosomal silencing factor RsfS n=1 Tax=Thermoactinomyces daqus TaxID=1329516 RepID=A0A7W1X9T2_9BACL|nr:ribosome silencing factor [Thermoactinomyces daqus]MBH8597344.1 ribosome silencing factor [Thermoactinomyces sp. CICC 10523]MBH8602905.1 ribosome silencing factor [Thermoactinomyces sp. CICC 10522]MBH8607247.1 ribosome silencing factor [Thermoactinomyces sp. CICC 10521]